MVKSEGLKVAVRVAEYTLLQAVEIGIVVEAVHTACDRLVENPAVGICLGFFLSETRTMSEWAQFSSG